MLTQRRHRGLGGASGFYPVSIPYSCRFDYGRSCKLTRTPGVAGNRKTWTYSAWIKLCDTSQSPYFFSAVTDVNNRTLFYFDSTTRKLGIYHIAGGSATINRLSTMVFRDYSAWFHLVVAFDTTQATASDRMKVYVNGTQITSWSTDTFTIVQNADTFVNHTVLHSCPENLIGCYLSDVYLIDGTALAPTSFGQFSSQNSSVWVPKTPTGSTYGTNGFHLAFADASALGTDTSGQGNNYTSSGLTTADQMQDTPTNNFCTWNALDRYASYNSLANGNLAIYNWSNHGLVRGTLAMPTSGKWYWEVKATGTVSSALIGIANMSASISSYLGSDAYGWGYYAEDGNKYTGGTPSAYGASYTTDDVIGVTFDADAGTLTFYKNNTTQGTAFTGLTSGPYFASVSPGADASCTLTANFGANGFAYTPPTGFNALCTSNMPVPGVGYNPSLGFDTKLYTGNGTSQNITSLNFQPDLVWIKDRTNIAHHRLIDSVRGATKEIYSSDTGAEYTNATGLTAFLTNGFSLGSYASSNGNGDNFASWAWKKSAAYGMDIVAHVGTGTNHTVSHSLGAIPEFIIHRSRVDAFSWVVYHKNMNATPQNGYLYLNTTDAYAASSGVWNNTAPTSSDFTLGTLSTINNNGSNLITYLFRSVPGFSMFGSYTGNVNADGPFVYCGLRPRYVLLKSSTYAGTNWYIYDAARKTYNIVDSTLYPNTSGAEATAIPGIDILSNGFKLRNTSANINKSAETYIFAAFAEAPFPWCNAR